MKYKFLLKEKKECSQLEEINICEACASDLMKDIQEGKFEEPITEAEYQGKQVTLNKPMKSNVKGKKSMVYVRNPEGKVVKVTFGDPNMTIKKHDPKRRKSFRARHNCDNPGPKTKARYWSCKAW